MKNKTIKELLAAAFEAGQESVDCYLDFALSDTASPSKETNTTFDVWFAENTIKVVEENPEMFENTRCYEKCIFCNQETNTWNVALNQPVCVSCAETHTMDDLKVAKEELENRTDFDTPFSELN